MHLELVLALSGDVEINYARESALAELLSAVRTLTSSSADQVIMALGVLQKFFFQVFREAEVRCSQIDLHRN